jgi:hypothetical protein
VTTRPCSRRRIIALDHLSDGRLEFGFGAGILEGDHAGAGREFWAKEERVVRYREAVEIVDRAIREETVSYQGKYYRTTDLWTSPGPVQRPRPPLVIGALSEAMLRVAVEFADTWNSWGGWVATEEEAYRRTVDRSHRLDDLCADIGRDPASIGRSLLVFESSGAYDVTPPTRAFSSAEGFRDLVERYAEIGITELIFSPRGEGSAARHGGRRQPSARAPRIDGGPITGIQRRGVEATSASDPRAVRPPTIPAEVHFRGERRGEEEGLGGRERLHDFSPVPPGRTGRKGRKPFTPFVQVEAECSLEARRSSRGGRRDERGTHGMA